MRRWFGDRFCRVRARPHEPLGWIGASVAVLGPPLVAALLIPLRGDVRDANVALVLVLVVLVAAMLGGRRGGAIAALSSALAFDFLFTEPYYSLRIDTRDDLETTLLLLGVGIVAGELVVRARRSRRKETTSRREVQQLRRIAQVGAGGEPPGRLIEDVREELCALFDVERCWFETPPFLTTMPRFRHGRVAIPTEDPVLAALDPSRAQLVELTVYSSGVVRGRFVLEFAEATAVTGQSSEARASALALVDQLGVALAAPND